MENTNGTNPKPTILIIGPPGDLQIGLQALLNSHLDIDVLATSGWTSAFKALSIYLPDLVILDNDHTLKKGLDIGQEIKTNWPDIPLIIFVTDDQNKLAYSDQDVELIVKKGYPGSELINDIRYLLDLN